MHVALGIIENDLVTIRSECGELTGRAHLASELAPDVVSVPHGLVQPQVNLLTSAEQGVDLLTGMPHLSAVRVAVEAVGRPRSAS